MNKKISVIINANTGYESNLDILKSISNQTIGLDNLEVVIVIEKTNNATSIIKQYEKYENFKIIQTNISPEQPQIWCNIGLDYVTSDYVMFVDNNVCLEPYACELLYNTITNDYADIISGSFTKKDNNNNDKQNYEEWIDILTNPDDDLAIRKIKTKKILSEPDFKLVVKNLKDNSNILGDSNACNKIFRTSLIKDNNILFSKEYISTDCSFILKSFLNSSKIIFINNLIGKEIYQRDKPQKYTLSTVNTEINNIKEIYEIFNKSDLKEIFNKYIFKSRMMDWFNNYLLKSNVPTSQMKFIFRNHQILFKKILELDSGIDNNLIEIFRDISNEKYDTASTKTTILNSKINPVIIKNKVKISIIIPIYNSEEFLEKCLSSIINQSLKEIEIICIDDGSTDNSVSILNEFKSKDSRVIVVSQKNAGAAIARNKGIGIAKGEYILFVDSDDWLSEDALIKLLNNALSNDSELILFNAVEHKNNGILNERIYMGIDSKDYNYFTFDYKYIRRLVMNSYLVIWSKLYKKSFLIDNNITFTNHQIFNDVQFHIKTMLLAKKISYCPEILYNYLRINQPSLQNRKGLTDKSFILVQLMDEIENYLKENNYYKEMELYFLKFKINELRSRLNRVNLEYKEEFYKLIRKSLINTDISSNQLKKIHFLSYRFYIDVLNNESYSQFKQLEQDLVSTSHQNILKKFSEDIIYNNNLICLAIQKINELNLFDEKFYRETYNYYYTDLDPLLHYLYEGYKENKNPNKTFDGEFYTKQYSEIKKLDMNPLIYFVLYGLDEGKILINSKLNMRNTINKNELKPIIVGFNKNGLNENKRSPMIIISLTSFPDRIYDLHYCIFSLLTQQLKPDKVVLWLAEEEFPNKEKDLTVELLALKNNGLEIKWCENMYSYKKLLPSLREFPNEIIVTADDDLYYPKDWLKELYENHQKFPNAIISHRSRKIKLNEDNTIKKYSDWEINTEFETPSYLHFGTNGAGSLFPPNSLNKEILNYSLAKKICPTADDIWFWSMAIKNKTKTTAISNGYAELTYVNLARESLILNEKVLWPINIRGKNDVQLRNILKQFPEIKEIIINDLKN